MIAPLVIVSTAASPGDDTADRSVDTDLNRSTVRPRTTSEDAA